MSYNKNIYLFYFVILCSVIAFSQEINKTYDQTFLNARFTFHKTYFEKATYEFDNLISQRQNDPFLYAYTAATDYMLFKNPTDKIKKVEQFLKKTNPNYNIIKALCYFAQQDFAKCELHIKKHLYENPEDRFAQHILGFTQIDLNKPEEGLKTLRNLVNYYPEYFPAYNHIGYAFLRLNKKTEALNAFNKFIAGDTLNPSAYDSYADGLSQNGETEKAIAQLTKAILLEPNFSYAWKHMGNIFAQKGQNTLAIKAYENALTSNKLYGIRFINSVKEKITTLKK